MQVVGTFTKSSMIIICHYIPLALNYDHKVKLEYAPRIA